MRLLMTGGGTGGHVYPALAVAEALADSRWAVDRRDMAWVGGAHSVEERILAQEGLAFYAISVGALRGTSPWGFLRSLYRIARGHRQAHELLDAFRPDVILATGGYVSVPLVWAARDRGYPVLIYLPDMQPGLAVKLLSRMAQRVAVSFDSVARYFPRDKVFVSGYPVRRALFSTSKEAARQLLGLDAEAPVLLVFGGSRGAHSLNEAVRRALEPLLELSQVVHISGPGDYSLLDAMRARLPSALQARYHLYAYLYERMAAALAAADLVVARAGAATLGEFPAVGLPAILVPYPYAGQHQQANAEYLASRGAALIIPDAELGARLWPTVRDLLGDPERLRAMGAAARALAMPEAAERIAAELVSLAARGG
jgi:UDP-N-acetylglucosamine--N-acetylmuramyl-(pentapeptide) pyrophosphoryl-undecaprenol N-acetylglucosamine transferase